MIVGYAAVFHRADDPGTEFELWADLVEWIEPGAFSRVGEDDVRGLFNHDPRLLLGRAKAGTLRLSVDTIGLRYEIDPPDTQAGKDTLESIRRGDVDGSSFAFLPRAVRYQRLDDKREARVLTDVEVFDVGPVTYPAYQATTSGVRGLGCLDDIRAERDAFHHRQSVRRKLAERLQRNTQ